MAKKNLDLNKDKNGRFFRNIGKYREFILEGDPSSCIRTSRPKFYLGTNESQARMANARLELLWDLVVKQWNDGFLNERHLAPEPVWDSVTMPMARAVAKGEMKVRLPKNPNLYDDPDLIYRWIQELIERYQPVIEIVPEFDELYQEGQKRDLKELNSITKEKTAAEKRINPRALKSDETLHGAFDAFIAHIRNTCSQRIDGESEPQMTAWGNTQIKNIGRLKEHHPNQTLSTLTLDVMEEMELHWAKRPFKKGTDQQISIKTAASHQKQLRAFFDWLHRNPKFKWRKPEDYGERRHRPKLKPQEVSQLLTTAQVETFTLDELCTLFEYAKPLEACLLLLGLNCGFGSAEIASLVKSEIHLRQKHPHAELLSYQTQATDSFIRRIRQKTYVYGEFKLWEPTVKGLEWVMKRRRLEDAAFDADSLVFITKQGQPFVKQTAAGNHSGRIPNIWAGLHNRIKKDHPDFRFLSFGKLRKTAGNFVKLFSDGEISGVFLCHGTPVKTDSLQDTYTNRPFGKVFKALDQVAVHLNPMFLKNPDVFSEIQQRLVISKYQNELIEILHYQGLSAAKIAETVGVSLMTVYRRIK